MDCRHDNRLSNRTDTITYNKMEARKLVEHMLGEHGNVESQADLKTESAKAVMKWLAELTV